MQTGTPFDFDPSTPLMLDALPRRVRLGLSRATRRTGPVVRDVGAHSGPASGPACGPRPYPPPGDLRATRESLIRRARQLFDGAKF